MHISQTFERCSFSVFIIIVPSSFCVFHSFILSLPHAHSMPLLPLRFYQCIISLCLIAPSLFARLFSIFSISFVVATVTSIKQVWTPNIDDLLEWLHTAQHSTSSHKFTLNLPLCFSLDCTNHWPHHLIKFNTSTHWIENINYAIKFILYTWVTNKLISTVIKWQTDKNKMKWTHTIMTTTTTIIIKK